MRFAHSAQSSLDVDELVQAHAAPGRSRPGPASGVGLAGGSYESACSSRKATASACSVVGRLAAEGDPVSHADRRVGRVGLASAISRRRRPSRTPRTCGLFSSSSACGATVVVLRAADVLQRVGGVEEHHHRDELAALDGEVDAPPPDGSRSSVPGPYIVVSSVPLTASIASRIASASSRRGGRRQKQRLSGSAGARAASASAALHVDGAGHDQLVDRLEPPAVADQLAGQPVEQLGMRRRLPLLAEVARRGDDPAAEVVLPEPVDDHPGQQVARAPVDVGEPVGQGRPAIRRSAQPVGGVDRPARFAAPASRISTCRKPCVATSPASGSGRRA